MNSVWFTFFSRISVALLNFAIVIITSQQLGAEGRGTMSLIALALAFTLLLHQLIGGNPLVYFSKTVPVKKLIALAYIWALPASLIVVVVLVAMHQLSQQYAVHVFLLSLIQAFLVTNTTLLLAFGKVEKQNLTNVLQTVLIISSLSYLFFISKQLNINSYITALYISFSGAFFYSVFVLSKHKQNLKYVSPEFPALIKEILQFGIIIQSTNLFQMFNYRLSYYLVNIYAGTKELGIFSTAMSVGESIWLFSRSLANVQYPKIVNSENEAFRKWLTIDYANAGFFMSLLLLLPLLLIPESGYVFLFGNEFSQVKWLIMLVAPGLILMGFTTMHAHYFSGIRKNLINLNASLSGLAVTLVSGFILIPISGLTGACITSNLSYAANAVYLIIVFKNGTASTFTEIIPNLKSVKGLSTLFRTTFKT